MNFSNRYFSKTRFLGYVLAVGTLFGAVALPSLAAGCCGGPASWYQPRRAEVLGRDAYLNRQINFDRGYLGGNYGRLEREDRAIGRQAQREAFFNGGYLTPGQTRQLNREENNLQRQVNYDHRWL
jgi:hypothetical protein